MTRVLVAEDNEDIQNLLRVYLKRSGAEVQIACNGLEVVEMALADDFDLVLLDIEMPLLNGIDTAKALREKGFSNPLYAFTANDDEEQIAHYLAQGFVGYLKKPLDPDQLNEIVQRYAEESTRELPVELMTMAPIYREENPLREDEDIAPLIDGFLARLPSTLNKMDYSLQRLDWESLASYAHQLKGAAGGFGYPALTDFAANLEKAVKNGEVHKAQRLFAELQFYVLGK